MIGKESKDKGSVPLHVTWKILESRRKKKDPIYEQQIALEHAEKFKLTDQQYEKLKKKLDELKLLKNDTITKVIDIRPKSEPLLKQVLAVERKSFSSEELQKVLAIIKEAA
jgi:DNA-directed RNA polymerase subunit F